MKAITTRSGVAYEGPSIPINPSPKKVVEQETEETTDKGQTNLQGSTAQIPPLVIPISIPESDVPKTLPKPNIPYPSRRDDQNFADALLLMPKFAPTIKSLLMNKEKLLELAKIPLNENCLAMLLKKLPENLGDPGKFLIPCNFPGMDLADRSITHPKGVTEDIFVKVGNFHFPTDFVVVDFEADPRVLGRSFLRTSRALIDVYKGELVLRDGNEQITFHVDGTSKHSQKHVNESIKMVNDTCKVSFKRDTDEPALVCSTSPEKDNNKEEKQEAKIIKEPTAKRRTRFTECLKNFKIIHKENLFHSKTPQLSSICAITSILSSIEPEDSLIMGDEHLSTCRVEEIIPIPRESEDTFDNNKGCDSLFVSKDDLKKDVQEENFLIYSNPLFEFDDNFNSSNINPLFYEMEEDVENENSNVSTSNEPVLFNTSFPDKDEYFDPGDDIDEIDTFLAMEVSTNIEEGYYDSEGDVIFLENLLSNDTTHNLSPEVFFDHEPQQNKPENDTLITFSPKSDPLHHEFSGEIITLPSRIAREHEEYLNHMMLLCGNSSSRSLENFHVNPSSIIESLPTSVIPVEDSDPIQEEIDIFTVSDGLMPPGIENDDYDSEGDIRFLEELPNNNLIPLPEHELPNLDHQDNPSTPRPPPEPPDVEIHFEPDTTVINNFDVLNKDACFNLEDGEIDVLANIEDNDSFTFVIQNFLPYLTYHMDSPLFPSTKNEDTIFDPDISI
ncbi:reverse transcriptase domain-containing protein [Tanacetum coccineum]|uniref:Reverse transcriptase domain-containing protein n=1 Tax=Tanacetum coccineum TaxID=301880 RepID=A0ABQ4WQE2_9ASTR